MIKSLYNEILKTDDMTGFFMKIILFSCTFKIVLDEVSFLYLVYKMLLYCQ
jgi:hypothetical protein